MSSINLYGCGGCGINIVSNTMRELDSAKTDGFAELIPYYIDTSKSNVVETVTTDHNSYFLDGVDGSGQKRDANHRLIVERARDMLLKFKPSESLNVVVHSAAGGSGSVIGPVLVRELLERNLQVIVLLIGESDTRLYAQNTLRTLQSYQVIAEKTHKPVIASYFENTKDTPRLEVDNRTHTVIGMLSVLFSGDNRELDSADLRNFLVYPNVVDHQAALAHFSFHPKEIHLDKDQTLATVATLVGEDHNHDCGIPPEYQTRGYIHPSAYAEIKDGVTIPLHAAVVLGYYPLLVANLEKQLERFHEARTAAKPKAIAVQDVEATEEGLVL